MESKIKLTHVPNRGNCDLSIKCNLEPVNKDESNYGDLGNASGTATNCEYFFCIN